MRTAAGALGSLVCVALVLACGTERSELPSALEVGIAAQQSSLSEWSEPVRLGPEINSSARELAASLSPDKLSLYFNSNRAEGLGEFDIWVSQRACLECPWEPAQNLGPPVNGSDNGGQAMISRDGHLLFFLSNREGSVPLADGSGLSEDLWMTRRTNPQDDFGWENPVNLGPYVNTEANETSPSYLVAAPDGHAQLYFSRAPDLGIFRATINRNGEVLAPAEPVSELGQPARSPRVRADGLELIFWANNRTDEAGTFFPGADLWVSTRGNVTDPWSTPQNLGPPVNSPFADLEGRLSHDGTTLLFASGQARGSLGFQDIWISTRTRGP